MGRESDLEFPEAEWEVLLWLPASSSSLNTLCRHMSVSAIADKHTPELCPRATPSLVFFPASEWGTRLQNLESFLFWPVGNRSMDDLPHLLGYLICYCLIQGPLRTAKTCPWDPFAIAATMYSLKQCRPPVHARILAASTGPNTRLLASLLTH